jgi:PKD repeat protein
LPVANAGEDIITCNSTVSFDGSASTDPDGSIVQYIWDFGDGSRGSGARVKHLYKQEGTYSVTLTVRDNSGTNCDSDSDVLKLVINSSPIADAGLNKVTCPEEVIYFDGSGSSDGDGSLTAFKWDFGDGSPAASGPKVSHSYNAPGSYLATLTVTDNSNTACAQSTDEIMVKVNSAPIAEAGAIKKGCIDEPIRFNGNSSKDMDGEIKKVVWDFGDGSPTIEAISPTHVYTNPGKYTVTLTVWDNSPTGCNMATDEVMVIINEPPIADAGEDVITCNTTVAFDGSKSVDPDGGSLRYEWDFGDGTPIQGGATPTHTFSAPGTYPVVLTIYDDSGTNCNSHSDNITVTINQPPVADAGESQVVCLNDIVSFNGSKSYDPEGGFLQFAWDFGDGTTKQGIMNPVHRYEEGGIYHVVLTVIDDSQTECNSSKDIITIQVAESPTAEAGEDKVVCAHTQVVFDGSKSTDVDGQVNAFYWDFGDGAQASGPTTTHSYPKSGEYTVTLTIVGDEIGNCDNTDTDFLKVTVHEAPTADAGENLKSCPDKNIKFDSAASTSSSEIIQYNWDFGDGTSSNQPNPTHSYTQPGVYQVKLKITDDSGTSCNVSEDSKVVTINAAPEAHAGADEKACINDILRFDGSKSKDPDGSILSYTWDFGDGEEGNGVNTTHAYKKSGQYEVMLTVTDNSDTECNASSDTKIVTINQPPIADAGSRQVVCMNESVQFDGNLSQDFDGNIVSYQWNFGDGATGSGQNPTHSYSKTGTYQASLIIKDDSGLRCDTGSSAVTIVVNQPPIADAGTDMITCPGQVITFDGSNSVDPDGELISYDWDFGDGTTGEWIKPTHKYEESGTYEVTLKVTDNSDSKCSTATAKVTVIVNQPPVADAGPDQMIACVGCAQDEVTFDASNSYDPEGGALTYRWDFGDGTQGTGVKTTHTYSEPGVYTVTLSVTDDSGTTCNSSTDVITVKANEAPSPEIDVQKGTIKGDE